MRDRTFVQKIAGKHFHRTRPTEWYDVLYREAERDETRLPWAVCEPNPNLLEWKRTHEVSGERALVIGCGIGDDAEEVAQWGLRTTAFDVSEEAISWCRSRFPDSVVEYAVGDLFALRPEWVHAFDFVLESYTIQAVPPEHRAHMIEAVASTIAAGGSLLTISRARDDDEDPGNMPWPLTRSELDWFKRHGLQLLEFDDYIDRHEDPPIRRFRTLWRRESD